MQYQALEDDMWRVFLRTEEFELLLKCARHQRARLAMLLMAISLRVTTAANLVVGQFEQDEDGIWWLHVDAKDATERDRATKPRDVLVPEVVIKELESFLGNDLHSLPDDKEVFEKVKRTLQRDIENARENAATASGNEDYLKVSSHDFRRYYASHFMHRLGLDPHAVRQMGGWKRIEHMIEYLLLPRDLLKDRFAEEGILVSDPLTMTRSGPVDEVAANFDTIEHLLYQVESEEVNERVQDRLVDLGEKVEGVRVIVDDHKVQEERDQQSETTGHQTSFKADFQSDTIGTVDPTVLAKSAYTAAVVASSWVVTLSPLF